MMTISEIYNSLLDILMPRKCPVCGTVLTVQEPYVCIGCLTDIPLTRLDKEMFNAVEQLFAGKVPIERASGLFYYSKGSSYASILHDIKYHNRPTMGRWMAGYLAMPLVKEGFFAEIDYITPIPLHFTKKADRGYNQSEYIARGFSDASHIPVINALKAVSAHDTQTHKGIQERWLNTEDIFELNSDYNLEAKHILLVDDVITTGATITSAAKELRKIADVKVSVLSLAVAQL